VDWWKWNLKKKIKEDSSDIVKVELKEELVVKESKNEMEVQNKAKSKMSGNKI